MDARLKAALAACRQIQKKHGRSYYFATLFLPARMRLATFALYAFFRVPDEIVDNPQVKSEDEVKTRLLAWRDKWRQAWRDQASNEPVLLAAAWVFRKYNIPYRLSEDFLAAMVQDTEKKEYQTYAELEKYMYGSAGVVGMMMCYVIGFSDPQALELAQKVGRAMQLTNFLRDIDEDYARRGRIYLPTEELARFGLSLQDIIQKNFSPDFSRFMDFQIARARKLYSTGLNGLEYLAPPGRLAVRTAAVLYGAILDKIKKQGNNVFAGRAHTGLAEKLWLFLTRVLLAPRDREENKGKAAD